MRLWIFLLAVFFAHGALAEDVIGRVRIHDGDTIRIGNQSIRLWGIDAPELQQMCGTNPCGAAARDALSAIIGDAIVTCTPKGKSYQRIVARCRASGADLGAALVRSGMAFAARRYSGGFYADDEKAARDAGLGVWAMQPVQDPALWRACRKGLCLSREKFMAGFRAMRGRILPFDAAYDLAYAPRVQDRGLRAVQLAINALPYKPDTQRDEALDPDAFWRHGGDCDKFALMKMLELRAQGVRHMAYVVFKNGPGGRAHAVLAVPDETGIMVALDNRFPDPVSLARLYRDYEPAYFIDVDSRTLYVADRRRQNRL